MLLKKKIISDFNNKKIFNNLYKNKFYKRNKDRIKKR